MTVRTIATFHTDLPNDAIETADGMDFIQWPGRNVVQVVADLLRAIGRTPDDPLDLEERGWDLDARGDGRMIRMRISFIEEVILDITDKTDWTLSFKRKPPAPAFVGMLVRLDAAMKADGRFRDILWFTREGYNSQTEAGSPAPVGADGAI
jgi:hypothetical protein